MASFITKFNPQTDTNTPNLLLHMLLLSKKPSVLLLEGFDRLLTVHQLIVLSSCSVLSFPQGVTDSINAHLIMVQLSEAQTQPFSKEVIHQCLVFLGLEIG